MLRSILKFFIVTTFSMTTVVFFTGCGEGNTVSPTASPSVGPSIDDLNDGTKNGDGENSSNGVNENNNENGGNNGGGNVVSPTPGQGLQDVTANVGDSVELSFIPPDTGADPLDIIYMWYLGTAYIADSVSPKLRQDNISADRAGVYRVVMLVQGQTVYESTATLTINP